MRRAFLTKEEHELDSCEMERGAYAFGISGSPALTESIQGATRNDCHRVESVPWQTRRAREAHHFDRLLVRDTIADEEVEQPLRSLLLNNVHIRSTRPNESAIRDRPGVRLLLRDDDRHILAVGQLRRFRERAGRDGMSEDGFEDSMLLLLFDRAELLRTNISGRRGRRTKANAQSPPRWKLA